MKNSTKGIVLCIIGLTIGYGSIAIHRACNFSAGEDFVFQILTASIVCALIAFGCVNVFKNDKP